MPVAELNGVRIAYEDTGGAGRPLVFSHGFLMDRSMFAPQVEALRSDHRCVSWDQRCFGETGPVDGAFTFWDSARDLLALCDHLGLEEPVLVGMSQGGFLGMRAALLRPDAIAGLVLIDTQAGVEDAEKVPLYEAMEDAWRQTGLTDQLGELVAATIMSPGWDGNAAWIERWRRYTPDGIAPALRCLFDRDDIHDRLPEIRCPALVIHGEADAAIEMDKAERLCAELADCRNLVRVAGAGHASNLSHPGPVNAAIREFLESIDA